MKKRLTLNQSGFTLIELLIALAVIIITAAGGVVVWQKKVLPTPTSTTTPTPQISPTILPEQPANRCSELNERDCLANPDCAPIYGPSCPACMDVVFKRCRERNSGEIKKAPWGVIGYLDEEVQLSVGEAAEIEGADLSLTLLKIGIPTSDQAGCCPDAHFDCPILSHECPVTIELEVRSGLEKEIISFPLPGFGTKESRGVTWRNRDVFGFRIRIEKESPELIILTVKKL